MNVTSKTIETNRIELTLTITPEELEKGLEIAFEKVRKDVTVEGFRKGKIPRRMFEKKFGVEVLYDDALNAIFPDVYGKALESEGIDPVDYPEWDVKEISKEAGAIATATVWTKPVVELGDYKGLEVTPLSEAVTEADIQAELDKLAGARSEMVIKEGAAQEGDIAIIDFEGFKDGVAFEGGKGENHSLELGSNAFIPGFESQVEGMAAGDEKEINVSFPEDYHAADLAGVPVVFKVNVHEVKTRNLPVIDDEFVKDLDREGIETVEALKADLTDKLTESKKSAAEAHLINTVIEQAVDNATFDVPDVMVENEISNLVRRMEQQYSQQGITLEMFLQFSGQTMESLREQMRPQAIKNVAQSLVIEAIIEKEDVEVTEEDVEKELTMMSEAYNMEVAQIKTMIPDLSMLRADVKSRKTVDLLVEQAKLV
ncbi:MAG: trigger factor [Defluviitaleaceae bacterium]|nr:trigger factor [Defluviitaleaceae bacterium]